ncbi:MAG: CsgG/HfaB family protein [Thermodesulfobacteriota bacterium]
MAQRLASYLKASVFLSVTLALYLLTAGCAPTTTASVKEDVTITGQTKELEAEGVNYRGPDYNVAIIAFKNKTPSKVLGVGRAATDILRTIVKKSGLEPILLTEGEMLEQERLIELQQTGALKEGKKDVAEGFESVDYRISGSVTAYSEVEESINTILTQSKTTIAKVQVDYALVDVQTGKSLLAESGMGEYRKKTGGFLGLGSRTSFDASLRDGALRDALTKAMTKMAEKLNDEPFTGRVLAVEGPTLYIRAGTRSRLDPGTVFSVYRTGKKLVDPDTGRVLGRLQQKVGEIVLTSHQDDKISLANVKAGAGFEAGDVIKESY